ncbi:MAG: hypothetical protein M0C28_14060 [Candidatus Moduliflexus flocculans]|nr:hypothetical protein [Candidatus Moduliflexus flocculans]
MISVPLAGRPCRYVRIRGRNFSVSEILGYDGAGRPLDRSGWRATNFLGETPAPRRVLSAVHVPAEDAPGREYAVAVTAGPAKFDPVDGVYVVALVDGRPVVPQHRAPELSLSQLRVELRGAEARRHDLPAPDRPGLEGPDRGIPGHDVRRRRGRGPGRASPRDTQTGFRTGAATRRSGRLRV